MRISAQTRLRRALDRREIPEHIQREVFNATFAKHSTALDMLTSETSFDVVLDGARRAKRALLSNKAKWPDELAPHYANYARCIQSVVDDIETTRMLLLKNPDNPSGPKVPASLSRITAIAAKRNAKQRANHEPEGPTCGASWPSWVEPELRQSIVDAFDRAYALMGRGRGRRFTPFHTTAIAQDMNRAIIRHRRFIDDQRLVLADRRDGRGSTHYRALHLCALRMAEMWLDGYERDIKARVRNPSTHPIPVNWMHMLTKDMRDRVRDADDNPAGISAVGLTSFYDTE